jgi:hypothetical protein
VVAKFSHKLVAHDGKYIVLPPGMGSQEKYANLAIPTGIHTCDTVQKYPIGTEFVNGLRRYYYSKANGECDTEWGAYKPKKTNTAAVLPTQATATQADGTIAGASGSHYLTITVDSEIGTLTTGVLSKDELAGGFIVVGNGSAQHPQMFQIVSHPALAAAGSLTIELDDTLNAAVTAATTYHELMESPFYDLKADGSGGDYVTFLGIPAAHASDGEFFWLQTWGPCWITSNSATCDSARDRTIVFVGNGSVESSNDETLESGFQIAGVALDMSGDTASNAPMVLLQIMP